VILLDADVLLIDLRYQNDASFPANRQVLDQINQGISSARYRFPFSRPRIG